MSIAQQQMSSLPYPGLLPLKSKHLGEYDAYCFCVVEASSHGFLLALASAGPAPHGLYGGLIL